LKKFEFIQSFFTLLLTNHCSGRERSDPGPGISPGPGRGGRCFGHLNPPSSRACPIIEAIAPISTAAY
jgi:hypothetical protein